MDPNKCYREYVNYFRQTFPFTLPPTFEEWFQNLSATTSLASTAVNNNFIQQQNETSVSMVSQPQPVITSQPQPDTISQPQHTISQQQPDKKNNKQRESWPKEQTATLINLWKQMFKEIETFKQPSVWFIIKQRVDKVGPPKSILQIKTKLRNMKKAYKEAKDHNSRTGNSPQYSLHYHDIDEMIGTRDVVNLQYTKQVGTVTHPPTVASGCKEMQETEASQDINGES